MSDNKFGLSKKTNVAIAAITAMAVTKDSLQAVVAVVIIAGLAITYQFILDWRKQ